ncbi:TPA: WxL domain-containing protein [Enterococcus faecalis]|nr:WxL domain-containing protein [Enterococcus faecalis]HBI1786802.1 WxL domain-containing protein [Enterococcus faecalis]HBI1792155.1 WxL domain-containing protein [Enterococcus faecalis]HBI1888062.1 WxL domain-containing protein [Enterococcus faecalis]HBI1898917.1 WxL domain-containing protein [Enterococcus faecalis]
MKKKQLFAGAAVLAMLSAGGTSTVFADDADKEWNGTEKSATTQATVTFLEDDETGTIVDPDNPDGGDEDGNGGVDPVDPTNPNGAELMISYASNLNFGAHKSKTATSFNALADKVYADAEHTTTKEVTPFVATKDSRGTDRKGWSLQAKLDDAFKDGSGAVLEGAELSLSQLRYANVEGAPTVSAAEKLVVDQEGVEVSNAGKEQGIGAWSLALGQLDGEVKQGEEDNEETFKTTSGVTLSVPSTTSKNTSTYSTTVTWELVADPSA